MKIVMNKPGYKHTPLGWIPEDWEVKRLGEICSHFKSGFGITSEKIFNTAKYPVYGGNGLRGYTNSFTHEGLYLLIGRQGALCGNIQRISGKNYVSEHAIALQTDDVADLNFLAYKLEYINLNRLSESSAQPGLAVEKLIRLRIDLPTMAEQHRIATILTTWDAAISKEQQLIDALQTRHRALMQQLLSGKKRLKGFKGEWKEVQINTIAKEVSLKNKEDKDLTVLSCTKYDGLVPSLEYFGRKIFSDDLTTYKIVPLQHFAYATNHIEEGSIGFQGQFSEALISPMYTVFKADKNEVNNTFLFRLLKMPKYILEYQRRMEGSIDRRGGLRWEEFSKIKIKLPSLSEQNAIAAVIVTSDKEIQTHRRRLAALQQQKKGLMQVLLTGKVRVKIKTN